MKNRKSTKWLVVLMLLWSLPALSETRRAFVVGIDRYDNFDITSQLNNAVSDATAVANALGQSGFDQVTLNTDITRFELNLAWQEFLETIDAGDTITFYFSGHGVAIDGKNYLLPRSMPSIERGRYELVKSESLSLNNLLLDVGKRDPAITVIILDACRTDPFASGLFRDLNSGGLAQAPEPPTGTFIMYSAAAGRVALDNIPGQEGKHSVYTKHLLDLIPRKDLNIAMLSRELRRRVNRTTREIARHFAQSPAYYDSIVGQFCLAGCDREVVSTPPTGSENRLNFRGSAQNKPIGTDRVASFQLQCDEGRTDGCFKAASIYYNGEELKQDNARAATLFQKACDGGYSEGCTRLGFMYTEGAGVAQDSEKSLALFQEGCEGDNADGCFHAASMYFTGDQVVQDFIKAAPLYQHACDSGHKQGCTEVASMYRDGKGVEQNAAKALALFRQGCEGRNADGCFHAASMYYDSEQVAQDRAEAGQLYQSACDLGYAYSCTKLGVMYRDGDGVARDATKAVMLFQQGCDGGSSSGCKHAQNILTTE